MLPFMLTDSNLCPSRSHLCLQTGEPFIAVTQTFFPHCRIRPCPDQEQDLNQTKMLRVSLGGWYQVDEGWILSTKLGWPMNAPHHSKSRE